MEQADLIWHNGELVAWEDAKVHVLTHGLHYGTGVFEGIRAYETARGTAIFRHREHLAAPVRARPSCTTCRSPTRSRSSAQATHELIAANELRECYIRPIAFRGYGQMGLYPLDCPVEVSIAVWQWAAYLGRRESATASGPRSPAGGGYRTIADPACQGLRPVPQQRPGQDRGLESRLSGVDPARLPRVRVRGIGRERLRGQGRGDPHPAPDGGDLGRHQPPLGDHDRLDLGYDLSSVTWLGPSCISPTRCS